MRLLVVHLLSMISRHCKYLVLLSSTVLAGCYGCTVTHSSRSSSSRIYTAQEVLPLAAGQRWTMKNQYGDLTYFQMLPRPSRQACASGYFLDMYITKDDTRAYLEPGTPGAWNHFILTAQNGSWRNVTNTAGAVPNPWLPSFETCQPTPIAGKPLSYFLLLRA